LEYRYTDRYYDRYSNRHDSNRHDMVAEWKREALTILPIHGSVLQDGDQVIRIDGDDNGGMLVFDLASCR